MRKLNDWNRQKIIHKRNILEFEYLLKEGFLTEIEDQFYYLNQDYSYVSNRFYSYLNDALKKELNIENLDVELNGIIKQINRYNEVKDVADSLMGKIADLKGITIKEVNEMMNIQDDSS